jgi:hypothetical protein
LSKIESIRLGRVDCSKEDVLKERFVIEGYPTLKVIRDRGKKTHGYTGQPESQSMKFLFYLKLNKFLTLKTLSTS